MKRTIFFIIFILLGIHSIDAQHLKFMGIPIDGNITSFQSKLGAKGIRIDREKSNDAPAGQRYYKGKFQGYNSEIKVYFNRKTKDVYKVEVMIESPKHEFIQQLLDKSVNIIEQKYIYRDQHDLDDGTCLHYQYSIFPTKESTECIGTIHVKPSYLYYVPDDNTRLDKLELASYTITFGYEDASNTSKLTPSTTEPKSLRNFACGNKKDFERFLSWSNNFRKHECYGRCLDYLIWTMDYYKYGCAPAGMEKFEDVLEEAIMSLQRRKIGILKTAYYKEYTDVYLVLDETTQKFKCIQFGVNSDMYLIKLDGKSIIRKISALERLINIYADKKKSVAGTLLNEYWTEDIGLTMPALIGRDLYQGSFGNIEWNNCNMKTKFTHYKQNLRVEVVVGDYEQIFLFCSEDEIAFYLEFLRDVQNKYIKNNGA